MKINLTKKEGRNLVFLPLTCKVLLYLKSEMLATFFVECTCLVMLGNFKVCVMISLISGSNVKFCLCVLIRSRIRDPPECIMGRDGRTQ